MLQQITAIEAPAGLKICENRGVDVGVSPSICLRISFYFPLLVLKGIHHYWNVFIFFRGLKQMEGPCTLVLRVLRKTTRKPWFVLGEVP